MADETPSKHRIIKIYFRSEWGQEAKNIAAGLRSQGAHCHLIDQQMFKDENDLERCTAVLIQKSAPKAKFIADLYSRADLPGLQIAFLNDDGEAVSEDEPVRSETNSVGSEKRDEGADAENTAAGTDPAGTAGSADVPEGDPADDGRTADA